MTWPCTWRCPSPSFTLSYLPRDPSNPKFLVSDSLVSIFDNTPRRSTPPPLQIRGCIPLPDLDTLRILSYIPQVPLQILGAPQVSLIPLLHLDHILPYLILPKYLISTPVPYLFPLKMLPLLASSYLGDLPTLYTITMFLSHKTPFTSSSFA